MRLLYLNHNTAGTGTYQRALNFARQMSARGHDVTLVTTRRAGRTAGARRDVDGVAVIEAPDLLAGPARNGWDPYNALWRSRRLSGERYDLIHAFDCRPVVIMPALVLQRRCGAALFMDWADWWGRGGTIVDRSGWAVRTFFGPVETWFEESFRTRAAGNTAISELLRERTVALGVPPERVLTLPNGCEPPASDAPTRVAARQRLGAGQGPLFAHLGVMQRPDAELLFNAFRLVLARMPAARLAVIGNFAGAIPADLTASVIRTGYVETRDMQDWLAAADAGVIPLRDTLGSRARWPGKINEYLTAGLPVVMPAVGAAAELVAAAAAGLICAPTAGAFADAMLEMVCRADQHGMGAAAHRLARGDLSWRVVTDRLEAFYQQWMSVPPAETRVRTWGAA